MFFPPGLRRTASRCENLSQGSLTEAVEQDFLRKNPMRRIAEGESRTARRCDVRRFVCPRSQSSVPKRSLTQTRGVLYSKPQASKTSNGTRGRVLVVQTELVQRSARAFRLRELGGSRSGSTPPSVRMKKYPERNLVTRLCGRYLWPQIERRGVAVGAGTPPLAVVLIPSHVEPRSEIESEQ